jgi:hypothetical protein
MTFTKLIGTKYKNLAHDLILKYFSDKNRETPVRFSIAGYPTLIYFTTNNTMIIYKDVRNEEKLKNFI